MAILPDKVTIGSKKDKALVALGTTRNLLTEERISKLRENTDYTLTLLENLVGYAIIAADLDGNIIAFNQGACQIYGYAPEEVIGKQNIDIFFPREFVESGKLHKMVNELLEKGRISWEGEKVRKNGERFPAQILFTLTRDKGGKVVGFIKIVEDLTERKRIDKQLIDSMSNFYKVINDSNDGIIITNRQGTVRYVNSAAESLFGRKSEDFKRAQFGYPIVSGGVTEIDIFRKAGEISIAEMRVSDTMWYGEKSLLISLHDITERKKSEEAVKYSELRYRRLFEAARDGILILNRDSGEIEDVNPFLVEILGYSREELLGKQLWEIGTFKDIKLAKSAFKTLEKENYIRYEDLPLQTKDGKLIDVEFVSNIYDIEGKEVIQCNIRNITEHKRVERQRGLSLHILERLNVGGNQADLIHDIITLIKEFSGFEAVGIRLREGKDYPYYDSLGFIEGHVKTENQLRAVNAKGKVIKDAQGNPIMECMCGNIICSRFNPAKPSFTKEGSFWTNSTTELLATTNKSDRQARTRNICNREGYESVALIPIKSGDNIVGLLQFNDTRRNCFTAELIDFYEGVSESIRTILERQLAQDVQRRLTQQLQAQVSELETFSYGIAHDLRSPLVSIQGFSRLLLTDYKNNDNEKVHEDIRLIESGVNKMRQLLDRTLEYSRASQLVKPEEKVSFTAIANDVIGEFAEQLHSIKAVVSLAGKFPKIYADELRIREALTNLIQNSIKYRDETRPLNIEIGCQIKKDRVVFFVRDNGIGIDASEPEKMFELFYRGTAKGTGIGAGLPIVKKIIKAHGGRSWAEGEIGKGTTIYFSLPKHHNGANGDNNGKD
jgi:PAS domain S-box-containing protein